MIIKDGKVTDAGVYTCTSNADKTECELVIQCKYCICDLLNVVETEQYVMNIFNFQMLTDSTRNLKTQQSWKERNLFLMWNFRTKLLQLFGTSMMSLYRSLKGKVD